MALRTQLQLFPQEAPTTAIEVKPPEKVIASKSARDFPRAKKKPSKFLWFWAGFAVTFSLLLVLSAWISARNTPSDPKMGGREKPVEVPRR